MIGIGLNINKQKNPVADKLLDLYPATVAYSTRKLSNSYTGNVMTVERTSDNDTQVIGFSGSEGIDTATIVDFCTGAIGRLSVWNDQSGNSTNASQSTAANRPKIHAVSTGLYTQNGLPAIFFDASQDNFDFANSYTTDVTVFLVSNEISPTVNFGRHFDISNGSNSIQLCQDNGVGGGELVTKNSAFQGGTTSFRHGITPSGLKLYTLVATPTTTALYVNGVLTTASSGPATGASGLNISKIGTRADNLVITSLHGYIQEFILYNSDMTSNREEIEANIISYYSIS